MIIPPEWADQLGPWESLLTSDPDDYDSPIFLACWEDYLHEAPMRVRPIRTHSSNWYIQILQQRLVQELVIDPEDAQAPTPESDPSLS